MGASLGRMNEVIGQELVTEGFIKNDVGLLVGQFK